LVPVLLNMTNIHGAVLLKGILFLGVCRQQSAKIPTLVRTASGNGCPKHKKKKV